MNHKSYTVLVCLLMFSRNSAMSQECGNINMNYMKNEQQL
jgi:hypothetical protein